MTPDHPYLSVIVPVKNGHNVLPRMLEKRFAFDLELLVVARRIGHGDPVGDAERLSERGVCNDAEQEESGGEAANGELESTDDGCKNARSGCPGTGAP